MRSILLQHKLHCLLLFAIGFANASLAQNDTSDVRGGAGNAATDIYWNPRCWSPGEPLQWDTLNQVRSLLALEPDYFMVTVSNPIGNKRKNIIYLKSEEGKQVLFIDGDFRYITYDMEGFQNQSRSNVVGYSYWSTPFFHKGQLHFQNGYSNWHIHANRHFHALRNGEIEILPAEQPPTSATSSLVLAGDSLSMFAQLMNEENSEVNPALVLGLPHNSGKWTLLGRVNPAVRNLVSKKRTDNLKDYWVVQNEGYLLIIRKRDLMFTQTTCEIAVAIKKFNTRLDRSITRSKVLIGNTYGFRQTGDEFMFQDIDSLVRDVDWKPFIVAAPRGVRLDPTYAEKEENDSMLMGLYILILVQFMGLGYFLWFQRNLVSFQSRGEFNTDGTPSALLTRLLSLGNIRLTSDELDRELGLVHIPSPETKRSRRSRMIQLVNLESDARFGQPIIYREKSKEDKRVVQYAVRNPRTAQ